MLSLQFTLPGRGDWVNPRRNHFAFHLIVLDLLKLNWLNFVIHRELRVFRFSVDLLYLEEKVLIVCFILANACSQSACCATIMAVVPRIHCSSHRTIVATGSVGVVQSLGEFLEPSPILGWVGFILLWNDIVLDASLIKFKGLTDFFDLSSLRWDRCCSMISFSTKAMRQILSLLYEDVFRFQSDFLDLGGLSLMTWWNWAKW